MNYYRDMLRKGEKFERFVIRKMRDIAGWDLTRCCTRKDQLTFGDTREGIEIKYDMRVSETHRLWIEVQERTHRDRDYVNSGIFARSSACRYAIGDYDTLWIFSVDTLKWEWERSNVIENGRQTSRGFLLSTERADEIAEYVVDMYFDTMRNGRLYSGAKGTGYITASRDRGT